MYTCPKCEGKGHINGYKHVEGGICFKCNGTGMVDSKPRQQAPKVDEARHAAAQSEYERKTDKAVELYQNDRRLRVTTDHPYYHLHAVELAKKDGLWVEL